MIRNIFISAAVIILAMTGDSVAVTPDTMESGLKTLSSKTNNAEKDSFDLGRLLYLRKKFKEAFDTFYRFSRLYRNSKLLPSAYYWMSLSKYSDGDFEASLKYARFIVDTYPDNPVIPDVKILIADSLYALGDFKNARLAYHDIIVHYSNSPMISHVYSKFAETDERLGLIEEEKEFYEFLIKHYPQSYEAKKKIKMLEERQPLSSKPATADGAVSPVAPVQHSTYYTIQVMALSDYDKAVAIKNDLDMKGLPAYIFESTINGRKIFRVRIGKFADKPAALNLMGTIADKTGYQGYVTVYSDN